MDFALCELDDACDTTTKCTTGFIFIIKTRARVLKVTLRCVIQLRYSLRLAL